MSTYFLYARKSTDEPDRQILSIEAQLAELRQFAGREHLDIVQTFIESQTAKEPGRPVFNEMLSLVEKGRADGILAWHPDRLARNSVDGGRIIYLIDRERITSLKFPTFWFDATPQGKFMLNIAFGQSKYYVDNLSENVKRGHRQKLRRGEASGVAPTGYLNDQIKHIMIPDPERFRLVRKMFELYATGSYSVKSLRKLIFEMGLVSRKGKKLSNSNVQKILTSPFYYGMIVSNGELFPGTHEPCVSKKLFDTVGEILKSKTTPKKRGEKVFPLRGVFSCGECGCAITAERQKGHNYYRCTKKKDDYRCAQPYAREELLAAQIDKVIQKVSLSTVLANEWLARLDTEKEEEEKCNSLFAQKLKGEIRVCADKLDVLLDAHLDRTLDKDEYVAKKNKVLSKKADLEQKLMDFERRGSGWLEPYRRFILTCNQAENLASENDISKKVDFLKKLGSNRLLEDKKIEIKFNAPWKFICDYKEKVGVSYGGPKTQNASEGGEFAMEFFSSGGLGFEPK